MLLQYDAAHNARVLVTVTFHFRWERLQYLYQSIKSLSEFPIEILDIVIITNTTVDSELSSIHRVCDPLIAFDTDSSTTMKSICISSHPDVANPWLLTWIHKQFIKDRFLEKGACYTHFLYIEDDIEFSFSNFCYFLRYREPLKRKGLIPSFLRIEYNHALHGLYCTDQFHITRSWNRKTVFLDGLCFMNMENPHIAMFILDRGLAEEYIHSNSFDLKKSEAVHTWGIAERASMGLCFENVPSGFYVRYVIPVNLSSMVVQSQAFIYHVSNNYTNDPDHPHGKIRVDQLITQER